MFAPGSERGHDHPRCSIRVRGRPNRRPSRVGIAQLRLAPGAVAEDAAPARKLAYVLSGEGEANGAPIHTETAIELEPGETMRVAANSELTLVLLTLPDFWRPAALVDARAA